MTDGAPYQFNYYGSGTVDSWNSGLLGNVSSSLLTNANTHFYNNEGKHWIGEAARKYCGMFALNEVASFIWDILPTAENEDEIVEKIIEEYNVSREQAAEDVASYLAELREKGIL